MSPMTPGPLSEVLSAPLTKPVTYSPVPRTRTLGRDIDKLFGDFELGAVLEVDVQAVANLIHFDRSIDFDIFSDERFKKFLTELAADAEVGSDGERELGLGVVEEEVVGFPGVLEVLNPRTFPATLTF